MLPALFCAGALLALGPPAAQAGAAGDAASSPRVEARSAGLLAVGVVHEDRMSIHLSRVLDNAPVRDATVSVFLRGAAHPTTADTDGGYTLQTKDLTLPGSAAVEIRVTQAGSQASLKGTLQIAADADGAQDKNSSRQLWWWVLNFAVCIGFLWLWSRRRKTAES
jgi:hypothetical protein